ncbi:leucine-rich repeat domain-containing protein [Candidatus Thorarchaeota archaeon]|nr:MAG: leucine-rich repeat domain-containing protein [Candidatus Thorarchaeota archaeon]
MDQIILRYETATGLEKMTRVRTDESHINLEVRDIKTVDLLPLIWCTNLEGLSLSYNSLEQVDLSPLNRCPKLQGLWLSHNQLQSIDFSPLSKCSQLQEICLQHNDIKKMDVSGLFNCHSLEVLRFDDGVTLTADVFLKSIGNWPDLLVEYYDKILWRSNVDWGKPE